MGETDKLQVIIKMIYELSNNNNLVAKKIIQEISGFFSNEISEEIEGLTKQIENCKERIEELAFANQYLKKNIEPQLVPSNKNY